MGNLSFEQGSRREDKSLKGWLSLSREPFKSRRARLSVLPRFRSERAPFRARAKRANPESRDSGYATSAPRNDGLRRHVSTNPVLDPLAEESFRPWERAR